MRSVVSLSHKIKNAVRPQEIYEKMGLVSKGILVSKVSRVTCPKDSLLHLDC